MKDKEIAIIATNTLTYAYKYIQDTRKTKEGLIYTRRSIEDLYHSNLISTYTLNYISALIDDEIEKLERRAKYC